MQIIGHGAFAGAAREPGVDHSGLSLRWKNRMVGVWKADPQTYVNMQFFCFFRRFE